MFRSIKKTKTPKHIPLVILLAIMAFTPLFLSQEAMAQPDLVTKVDSLRWRAMEWEREGNAELAVWRDSLYACMTSSEDDGSGVKLEGGPSDGLTITPGVKITPNNGLTMVWEGSDGIGNVPYDLGIVEITMEDDPVGFDGRGLAIGVGFPPLFPFEYDVVIELNDSIVFDEPVEDPGYDPPPPGYPLPIPEPIVWIGSGSPGMLEDEIPLDCRNHMIGAADDNPNELSPALGKMSSFDSGMAYMIEFEEPKSIKLANGPDVGHLGDKLWVIPKQILKTPAAITAARVIPRQMHEGIIKDASFYKFGIEHRPTGNPFAEIKWDNLTIRNVSNTGE